MTIAFPPFGQEVRSFKFWNEYLWIYSPLLSESLSGFHKLILFSVRFINILSSVNPWHFACR